LARPNQPRPDDLRTSSDARGAQFSKFAAPIRQILAGIAVKNAIHVGHSTGGGEVARYLGRHGKSRVAKAALISAVPEGLCVDAQRVLPAGLINARPFRMQEADRRVDHDEPVRSISSLPELICTEMCPGV
jgi:pimeloyl-ACP methyl ester carboxylesterase